MTNNPIIMNGLLGNVRTPFPIDGKTAADAATMNGVQQENYAQELKDAAAQAAGATQAQQDAAAQQFYADQQAHPEWFEGDVYLGGNPADHLAWRKSNPDAARKLAEKTLPTVGLLAQGNIDLANRPIVHNPDGSYSTVASMSFQDDDGTETLIPTVAEDGSGLLSDEDAIQQYRNTGRFLGKFSSPEAADNYALALHDQQDAMYVQRAAQQEKAAQTPQDTMQSFAQGLLGPYAADTPAQRAFDAQLYDSVVKPQMDAALLPYREAQYAANDAAIRRAHPDTVMGAKRQLVDALSKAKAAYDNAKAAGNEQGMALAHQAAEQLRSQAASIGFDLGDYGGNSDTNAMVQALANNDARAYAAVIDNDMAPEQYYQQLYNRARNSGMSRKESEGYAQAHTEHYQAERNARMQSAFYTYGIQNGAITPYGMQILTKWAAGEDPQAFLGITAKAFGLPIDNFKLGAQRQLASDQNGYTMQQIDAKSKASMAELMQKIAGQFGLEQLRHQFDIDTLDHKFPMDMALASVRASRSGGGDSSSKSSSSSGSGKEFDKGQREILNEVGNKFENVKSLAAEIRAEGGNNAPAELHQQLRDAVGDLTDFVQSDDVSKAFPPDQREELGYYAYGAQFYLGKANGYEGDENNGEGDLMKDACHQLANNVPEDWLQKHMGYTREDFGDWVES